MAFSWGVNLKCLVISRSWAFLKFPQSPAPGNTPKLISTPASPNLFPVRARKIPWTIVSGPRALKSWAYLYGSCWAQLNIRKVLTSLPVSLEREREGKEMSWNYRKRGFNQIKSVTLAAILCRWLVSRSELSDGSQQSLSLGWQSPHHVLVNQVPPGISMWYHTNHVFEDSLV